MQFLFNLFLFPPSLFIFLSDFHVNFSIIKGSGGYGGSEKRRKPMQMSSMSYILDDGDIIDDLKIINKNKVFSKTKLSTISTNNGASATNASSGYYRDTRIEDGKLFYEKRWFRRGQTIQVEQKNGDNFSGVISAIGTEALWVRRNSDSSKMRIFLTQLTKGKITLKRRAV